MQDPQQLWPHPDVPCRTDVRNAKIDRFYEGMSEIQRLVVPSVMLRRPSFLLAGVGT